MKLLPSKARKFFERKTADLNYKSAVGGHWDDVGKLQFEYLQKLGLQPHHKLLDLPCGSLRVGRFLVDYLNDHCYYGTEGNPNLIKAGLSDVLPAEKVDVVNLKHVMLGDESVNFQQLFKTHFDFIWVHALFDHIPHQIIIQFLKDITSVMNESTQLYATIFLNPHGENFKEPIIHPRYNSIKDGVITFSDKEYWHHTIEFFEIATREIPSLQLDQCLYDYPHPLGLRVLKFSKQS